MKRILLTVLSLIAILSPARADEGMWMLPLLEKINSEALANLGSRLSTEQIYSVNNASIKDAIVQFGGGCTGEIISRQGLLVTNHHCGYSSIQSLSSPEHNYLEDGFWAMSLDEEIPVPGLTVKFLQSMSDVTGKIKNEKDRAHLIAKAQKQNPNCKVEIVSFYNDNVQYLIISKVYRDVRFVGAPPAASGKFGGDTDNWMWPRHTCDFSTFRVYAGKDNEPADYSAENVPFIPRHFLSISLKGVNEGDFAMVMGYPGRTQRFQTAAQLSSMLDINEVKIAARTVRQDVMRKAMRSDATINLQYANKYASSSNGWKKWQGMRSSFAKLKVIERELDKEAALEQWISQDKHRISKYSGAINEISQIKEREAAALKEYTLLSETLMRIELLSLCKAKSTSPYKDYNPELDREIALAMIDHYNTQSAVTARLDINTQTINELFDKSVYCSIEKLNAARASGQDLSQDPARLLLDKITNKVNEFLPELKKAASELETPAKRFAAALLEWNAGQASYPDANFTCRLSYGSVKGYSPRDGVIYRHYTTLKGVMEKEQADNYEFRVPARLKEIYNTSDYGQYANANGELVTCFLTNLDITGGNSGSPVMDADGNLIGLAFDGNWESMSSDVIFEPEYQRCICVDIHYVLLYMDKFGGAGYLLDEMNIIR